MAKKTVTINLSIADIKYDIQDKTYLTGRSRYDGNNEELTANMRANDDEENLNQIMRSVTNAFSNLKTFLAEYIVDLGITADNKLLSASTDLSLALSLPSNFNESGRTTIANGCHQYIVNSAISEWFLITNKADAADYVTLAQNSLKVVRNAINRRTPPSQPAA